MFKICQLRVKKRQGYRRQYYRAFYLGLAALLWLGAAFYLGQGLLPGQGHDPWSGGDRQGEGGPLAPGIWPEDMLQGILAQVIPGMSRVGLAGGTGPRGAEDDRGESLGPGDREAVGPLGPALFFLTGVDPRDPRTFLGSQLASLDQGKMETGVPGTEKGGLDTGEPVTVPGGGEQAGPGGGGSGGSPAAGDPPGQREDTFPTPGEGEGGGTGSTAGADGERDPGEAAAGSNPGWWDAGYRPGGDSPAVYQWPGDPGPGERPGEASGSGVFPYRPAPLVIIYHSHTTESFVPTSGKEFTTDLTQTVVRVGEELASLLEEDYGIKVVHHRGVHDLPRSQAYARAEETVKGLVKKYPEASLVIDLHRDGISRVATTTTLEGKEVGRTLLVMGTNHARWRENYSFALEFHEKSERLFPGLSRGIRDRSFTYNQDVHPRAILLEVGGHRNSLEEALATTGYLARIIGGLLLKN